MKALKFCYSRETAEAVRNLLQPHSQGHPVVVVPDGGRFAVCVDAPKIPQSLKAALREVQRAESERPAAPGRSVDEALQTLKQNQKVVVEEVPEKSDAEKLREMLAGD